MMLDVIAAVAAPAPAQTVNTVITVIGTVVVAAVGGTFAVITAHRKKEPDPPAGPSSMPPSPLANFSGTQNDFMALVVQDNQALREQMRLLEGRVTGAEEKAASAETAAHETKQLHSEFQRAVRRYLLALSEAWTGPTPMPNPREEDLGLLEHTLPRLRRRST